MLKVSFCVPVYNRADRIQRCIESLINQTASNDEYEIIVVDDCSTDGTVKVIEDLFATRGFANGHVTVLPANSGNASAPRNRATQLARGEYLFFVDSDDYVAPTLVEKIAEFAAKYDSDLIYPRYRRETETGEVTTDAHVFARRGDQGQGDIVRDRMLNAMSVLKAFKRSEWERLGMSFDTTLLTGEDILVVAKFLFNTTTHSIIADQPYYMIVDHTSHRLTKASTSRARTFQNYGVILDIIATGTLGDQEFKLQAAAKFVERLMRVGSGAGNGYLAPTVSEKSRAEWASLFSRLFTDHLPKEADQYLLPVYREKVAFLRDGDLDGARTAVEFHAQKERLERLLGVFTSAAGGKDADKTATLLLASMTMGKVDDLSARVDALRQPKPQKSAPTITPAPAAANARALADELSAMRSSLSWRVTAPLRSAARLTKQFRNLRSLRASAPAAVRSTRRAREVSVTSVALDDDGRPEIFMANVRAEKDFAVFASVSPAGHRDARHRLPLREVAPGKVAARLPVPHDVGHHDVALTVESSQGTGVLVVGRRLSTASKELRVRTHAKGLRIERLAAAAPWRPQNEQETNR